MELHANQEPPNNPITIAIGTQRFLGEPEIPYRARRYSFLLRKSSEELMWLSLRGLAPQVLSKVGDTSRYG